MLVTSIHLKVFILNYNSNFLMPNSISHCIYGHRSANDMR